MSAGFGAAADFGQDLTERLWFFGSSSPPFSFDAVIRESHSSELTVTENPVETGVVIADHAFMQPLHLEIEAAVGDASVRLTDPSTGAKIPDAQWLRGGQATRSVNAFAKLQALQAAAEPFSIQTGLRLYRNMVVRSLSAETDKDNATMLLFRASLTEVIRVSTETVTFTPRKVGKPNRQASKPVNGGDKNSQQVTDPKKAQSGLLQLIGKDKVDQATNLAEKFTQAQSGVLGVLFPAVGGL